jgi:hypothetical protein
VRAVGESPSCQTTTPACKTTNGGRRADQVGQEPTRLSSPAAFSRPRGSIPSLHFAVLSAIRRARAAQSVDLVPGRQGPARGGETQPVSADCLSCGKQPWDTGCRPGR